MRVRVECYSGRKADERPVRFWLDERVSKMERELARGTGKPAIVALVISAPGLRKPAR